MSAAVRARNILQGNNLALIVPDFHPRAKRNCRAGSTLKNDAVGMKFWENPVRARNTLRPHFVFQTGAAGELAREGEKRQEK
jgi:hypothetical protein